MSIRGKIAIALSLSAVVVVGVLYFVLLDRDNNEALEESVVEAPEKLPDVSPPATEPELAVTAEEAPPSEEAPAKRTRTRRGWILKGRIVDDPAKVQTGEGPLTPMAGALVSLTSCG